MFQCSVCKNGTYGAYGSWHYVCDSSDVIYTIAFTPLSEGV